MSKLSRRKYAELVKFLKSVITNKNNSLRVRMQAAGRLDAIYERHEHQQELADARQAREQARADAAALPREPLEETPTETPDPIAEDTDRIRDVFDNILRRDQDAA